MRGEGINTPSLHSPLITWQILKITGKGNDIIDPFVREISILEQLQHRNIAKYLVRREGERGRNDLI